MRRGLAAGLLFALLCHARPAAPQVLYRTQPGETLAELGQRFYGDASFADLIAQHNGVRGALEPGVELRLPSASRHTVERAESWNDLAARYWGDASLGRALARWCGAEGGVAPRSGEVLTIPALTTHRLAPGETLVGLARRFYRDPARAEELGRLNQVKDPRQLHSGRQLRIPLLATVILDAPAKPVISASESPDVASRPAPPGQDFSTDLMAAVNAYLDGDFEGALARLERERSRVLASGSDQERGQLLRYLIYSYVAFDRDDAACDAFAALQEIRTRPDMRNAELVSPKIQEVLARCDRPSQRPRSTRD
jgi:LysM repeat protein